MTNVTHFTLHAPATEQQAEKVTKTLCSLHTLVSKTSELQVTIDRKLYIVEDDPIVDLPSFQLCHVGIPTGTRTECSKTYYRLSLDWPVSSEEVLQEIEKQISKIKEATKPESFYFM